MTMVAIPPGLFIGPTAAYLGWSAASGSANVGTMDAATEKVAIMGCMHWADEGTHTVSSSGGLCYWFVHTSGITFNNGSTNLRIGIQDVHATNIPIEPDASFDVYADLVGGTDTITAGSFRSTAFESGSKSIAHGAKIAFVLDLTARGGADSVLVGAHAVSGNPGLPAARPYNSSAWQTATSGVAPALVIVADDGTLGTISGCYPFGIVTTADSWTDSTNPDERGNLFTPTFDCKIGSIRLQIAIDAANDDCTFDVFSDPTGSPTSVISGPITIVPEHYASASGYHEVNLNFPSVTLSAGTTYGYAVKATGAGTISTPIYNYGASGNANLVMFAPRRITRNGGSGAYTDSSNTQVCGMWLGITQVDDGEGAGGSGGKGPLIDGRLIR